MYCRVALHRAFRRQFSVQCGLITQGGVDRIADARRQEPTLNELACQIKQDMQTEPEAEYEDEHEDASWAYLAVEHSMWEEKIRA